MQVLEVRSGNLGLANALSNFTKRPFVLDEVTCGSMEGFLQSLKSEDPVEQRIVAKLVGFQAKSAGKTRNDWKHDQILFWRGDPICRHSLDYQELLTLAYDAQFDQNTEFQEYLLKSVGFQLRHSLGCSNPYYTVLTEREFVGQLERLRWRALERYDVAR